MDIHISKQSGPDSREEDRGDGDINSRDKRESEDNASESDEYCSDKDVRLVADCEEVKFEFRDEMAGVSFTKDGEEWWTPVKRRMRRSRVDDSNDEIQFPEGTSIRYMQVGRTPILSFATRRTLSTSIKTRKKDRVCYQY